MEAEEVLMDDHRKVWKEHDQREAGTPYWERITDPKNAYCSRLITLLSQSNIEYRGNEFIMKPDYAVELIDKFQEMGVAVHLVTVWCFIAAGENQEECCPDGYGGPGRHTEKGLEWYSEYAGLGVIVPGFEEMPKSYDLAEKCNPVIKDYIQSRLPQHPAYSERMRVTPYLYVPLMWDLFPDS